MESPDLDPSLYTGKSLEELRESKPVQHKHEISEEGKENARLYARVVNSIPDKGQEPSNLDEALDLFNKQYQIRKVGKLPRPKIQYPDARVLLWEILKYLHQTGDIVIEKVNKSTYTNLLKYFICDPSCEFDLRRGIYIWGNVGRGKTYLMRALRILIETIRFDFRKFEIQSCRDIVFDVTDQKSVQNMRKYFSGKYCFDDFGYEDTQVKLWGNELNVMEEIMVNRYDAFVRHGLITHVTTNIPPHQIVTHYESTRLESRIEEMFNIVELKGDDKRKM